MKVGVTLIKTCIICGKEFVASKFNSSQLTCSPECSTKRHRDTARFWKENHRKPKPFQKVACHICGKEFFPSYPGQKYCSEDCRNDPKAKMMRLFFSKVLNGVIRL